MPSIKWKPELFLMSVGLASLIAFSSMSRAQPVDATDATNKAAETVLDFEGINLSKSQAGNIQPAAGSTIKDDFKSQGVLFGKQGISAGVAAVAGSLAPSSGTGSVAGLDSEGIIPGTIKGCNVGDIYFHFCLPGTDEPAQTDEISFTIGDAGGDIDEFVIRLYDASDALVKTKAIADFSRFSVSFSHPGIHRVEIDFSGDYGYSLDDLSFNTPQLISG